MFREDFQQAPRRALGTPASLLPALYGGLGHIEGSCQYTLGDAKFAPQAANVAWGKLWRWFQSPGVRPESGLATMKRDGLFQGAPQGFE